ncbi:MAG: hypothetical protein Q9166_005120 [cf. Caloplaca sp. 2 TL-2023]
MADLSSLLNPAPSSERTSQEADNAEKTTSNTTSNGRGKSAQLPPVNTEAPNMPLSIKSPLDTLADAATSSAPLLSPTNPNTSLFMNLGAYGPPAAQSTSRSTSSHITPPLPYDQSHPAPTSPSFSPGLQQYHHPTSNEIRARRASETAENSVESLPPLRWTLPEQHIQASDHSLESLQHEDPQPSILPGISAAAGLINSSPIDDAPATPQMRQSSPRPSLATQTSNLLPAQQEQAQVKTEISDMAPDLTSSSIQPPAHLPEPSTEPKQESEVSVMDVDNVAVKRLSAPTTMNDSTQSAMPKPPPSSSRKRPAPKKGTATAVKPASKKRKIEKIESIEKSSPLRGTPTSSRASKTPAPRNRKQNSATPQRSSSIANDDDDEDEDGVFCICRGPDNHTWMIACDGPCEDWFHGRCINMTEKEGDLIEKYYCMPFPNLSLVEWHLMLLGPSCTEAGKGETLWKRKCRLDGCIRPARINGAKKSKYCSDEHGCEFMKQEALKGEAEGKATKAAGDDITSPVVKKGRKTNNSFAETALINDIDAQAQAPESSSPRPATNDNEGANGDESQSRLRGGILRSSELKALVSDVRDVSEFHKLGNGTLGRPPTSDPNAVDTENTSHDYNSQIPYTPAESDLLRTLSTKKDELRSRKKMLDDRDTFLTLVRDRAKTVLDELKKKENNIKDICGFDIRLIWSDEEFEIWRNSPEGESALKERKLGAPTVLDVPMELAPHLHDAQKVVNGDLEHAEANGEDPSASGPNSEQQQPEAGEIGKGVCQKKRCERHKAWYKLQQQEIAFAKDEVRQGMRKLEEEENGVRDRAKIRWLEAKD